MSLAQCQQYIKVLQVVLVCEMSCELAVMRVVIQLLFCKVANLMMLK